MRILTKILKKRLNEAGIPTWGIINGLSEHLCQIRYKDNTLQLKQFNTHPSRRFCTLSFRME
jgi:hypothetical protein